MRVAFLFFAVAATFALAQVQPTPCTTRCNVQASDCMKACVGEPKDAQRPEKAQHLMSCMKTCEDQNRQCKASCEK